MAGGGESSRLFQLHGLIGWQQSSSGLRRMGFAFIAVIPKVDGNSWSQAFVCPSHCLPTLGVGQVACNIFRVGLNPGSLGPLLVLVVVEALLRLGTLLLLTLRSLYRVLWIMMSISLLLMLSNLSTLFIVAFSTLS